jgi:hypothetical protein
VNSDRARAAVSTRVALNLVHLSPVLAWSIIPTLAEQVLSSLGEKTSIPPWPTRPERVVLQDLLAERPIRTIGPLVAKLGAQDIARLSHRFKGDTSPGGHPGCSDH